MTKKELEEIYDWAVVIEEAAGFLKHESVKQTIIYEAKKIKRLMESELSSKK